MTLRGSLEQFPDARATARAAAESFARRAAESRADRFTAALTGGGSPVELYHLLGTPEFAGRIPWDRVHLFWGDERAVPPGHPRSNYAMAREQLISRVPIPRDHVHRIRGELGAERASREYAAELRDFFGGELPRFDLVHLGLGADGHVCSLFPFDLDRLLERERWVLTSVRQPIGEPRVTLSFAVVNAARRVEVLLPDESKAAIARRVIRGPLDPLRLPAQLVRPHDGELAWMASRPVAQRVSA